MRDMRARVGLRSSVKGRPHMHYSQGWMVLRSLCHGRAAIGGNALDLTCI